MIGTDLIDLNATIATAEGVVMDPRRRFTLSSDAIMALCHCLVALSDDPGLVDCAIDGGERRCRVCGCTQENACVDDQAGPCWWVEADLCSHCQPTTNARLAGAVASAIKSFDHVVAKGGLDAGDRGVFIQADALLASLRTLKTIFETEFPNV